MGLRLNDFIQGAGQVGVAGLMEGYKADIMAQRDAALNKIRQGERKEDRAYKEADTIAAQKFKKDMIIEASKAGAIATEEERAYQRGRDELKAGAKVKAAALKSGSGEISIKDMVEEAHLLIVKKDDAGEYSDKSGDPLKRKDGKPMTYEDKFNAALMQVKRTYGKGGDIEPPPPPKVPTNKEEAISIILDANGLTNPTKENMEQAVEIGKIRFPKFFKEEDEGPGMITTLLTDLFGGGSKETEPEDKIKEDIAAKMKASRGEKSLGDRYTTDKLPFQNLRERMSKSAEERFMRDYKSNRGG